LSSLSSLILLVVIALLVFWSWFVIRITITFLFTPLSCDRRVGLLVVIPKTHHYHFFFFFAPYDRDRLVSFFWVLHILRIFWDKFQAHFGWGKFGRVCWEQIWGWFGGCFENKFGNKNFNFFTDFWSLELIYKVTLTRTKNWQIFKKERNRNWNLHFKKTEIKTRLLFFFFF
jgi:hypothetical protein